MIRNVQVLILLFAAMIAFDAPAHAAKIELKSYEMPDGKYANIIRFSGEFIASDFVHFQRLVSSNQEISAVLFENSPGGLIRQSLEIGRLVRERKLSAIASVDCASACGIAWMGGVHGPAFPRHPAGSVSAAFQSQRVTASRC